MSQTMNLKCVVVGHHQVGKKAALWAYTTNCLPEYIPVWNNTNVKRLVDDQSVNMSLWDVPALQLEYLNLLPQNFRQTDVFVVMFSITDPSSFERVWDFWAPLLQQHSPGTPIIIAGNKCDIREDQKLIKELVSKGLLSSIVTAQQGRELASRIALSSKIDAKYIECSALTQEHTNDLFTEAIRAAVAWNKGGKTIPDLKSVAPEMRVLARDKNLGKEKSQVTQLEFKDLPLTTGDFLFINEALPSLKELGFHEWKGDPILPSRVKSLFSNQVLFQSLTSLDCSNCEMVRDVDQLVSSLPLLASLNVNSTNLGALEITSQSLIEIEAGDLGGLARVRIHAPKLQHLSLDRDTAIVTLMVKAPLLSTLSWVIDDSSLTSVASKLKVLDANGNGYPVSVDILKLFKDDAKLFTQVCATPNKAPSQLAVSAGDKKNGHGGSSSQPSIHTAQGDSTSSSSVTPPVTEQEDTKGSTGKPSISSSEQTYAQKPLSPTSSQKHEHTSKHYPAVRTPSDLPSHDVSSAMNDLDNILSHLGALEGRLTELDTELDRDPTSHAQRQEIFADVRLSDHYEMLRKVHYHFVAAQVLMTGRIDQAEDTTDKIIKAGAALGKCVPGVNLLVTIVESAASVKHGIAKHQAMTRVAEWVQDTAMADKLAERFARHLTFHKKHDILTSSPSLLMHETLIDKVGQAYREVKENKSYSLSQKAALADTVTVLQAIMTEEITRCGSGVSDEQMLKDHLVKMLHVFGAAPVLSKRASVTSVTTVTSVSALTITLPQPSSHISTTRPNQLDMIMKLLEEQKRALDEQQRMFQDQQERMHKLERQNSELKKQIPQSVTSPGGGGGGMSQLQLSSSDFAQNGSRSQADLSDQKFEAVHQRMKALEDTVTLNLNRCHQIFANSYSNESVSALTGTSNNFKRN